MKAKILLLLLAFAPAVCGAQTKVIAHKSHSGSRHSFRKAYSKGLFDINQYNFGLPGKENLILLDKATALNDSVTVLQKRESKVCYRYGTDYRTLKDSDFKVVTDTVVNHPLLNRRNTITAIKASQPYGFANAMSTVKFVGFKK